MTSFMPRLIRSFSVSTRRRNIRNQEIKIPPFGKLRVSSGTSLVMSPVPVHKSMSIDIAYLLQGTGKESLRVQEDTSEVFLDIPRSTNEKEEVHVEFPINYDLTGSLREKANLTLHRMENEVIDINAQGGHLACRGSIACRTFRWHNKESESNYGGVEVEKGVQGNVNIVLSGAGGISTGKLQGDSHHLETEFGGISVEALYGTSAKIVTQSGCLDLKSIHAAMDVDLGSQGSLMLRGLEGSIQLSGKQGNVDIAFARMTGDSCLHLTGSGDITIRMNPSTFQGEITIQGAADIEFDEELEYVTDNVEGEVKVEFLNICDEVVGRADSTAHLHVQTGGGRVAVKKLDWLASFLGKQNVID